MNDKYAKEIAKELRLIRIELQKENKQKVDLAQFAEAVSEPLAGERVTIK